ncbi:TFIIS N-terminal domain-containing protein [Aphelenchoides besseyi]|nr:TFIIS N-terminal domain-containing protein [Aphelenchoides besseyi]KAI6210161.1 TFIIS N-terminal domain-containing protein [Aphelenchoides besseyi]
MSSDPTAFRSNQKTKVYAGRRRAPTLNAGVPTLLNLCQRFVQEHVDQLEEVGDVPFHLLCPVFESCTIRQLERIAAKNPALEEELDPVWKKHVLKVFPKDAERKKPRESWWRFYRRLCREREEKFQEISQRIKQAKDQRAVPEKTTMLSEVINPVNMQKKQLRNGLLPTAGVPDALKTTRARRAIFNSGSKDELRRLNAQHPVQIAPGISSTARVYGGSVAKAGAPKVGALMAKSLKMMKNRRR